MSIKILNADHRILATDDLPERHKQRAVVLYYPRSDVIVLNEDNPALNEIAEIISAYLSLTDLQRKTCMDEIGNHKGSVEKYIFDIIQVLNRVVRIRRKLNQHAAA